MTIVHRDRLLRERAELAGIAYDPTDAYALYWLAKLRLPSGRPRATGRGVTDVTRPLHAHNTHGTQPGQAGGQV